MGAIADVDPVSDRNRRVPGRRGPIRVRQSLIVGLTRLIIRLIAVELPIDSNRPIDLVDAGRKRHKSI
jgi:hypothetical protein